MRLTPKEAAALLAKVADSMDLPPIRPGQIHKILEFPLRSGGRYVEVYLKVAWASRGKPPRLVRGVTAVELRRDARGEWTCVGYGRGECRSDRPEALAAALAELEKQQSIFHPKTVKPRKARPQLAAAAAALPEAEGAGALAKVARVGDPPLSTDAEVDAAERSLGTRLPAGYRTFVTRLGEGVYATLVRVYPPARVVGDLTEWRDRIEQHWFWGESPVAQETALESICVADTIIGDEIIFHPSDPDALFLLPRESERARKLGRGLAAALAKVAGRRRPRLEA